MTVAVITSRYGDVDPVVDQPEQTVPVEWICVTDNPDTVPGPWRRVHEPRPHLHPRMAGKVARCRPDLYTDADIVIWLDASARLLTETSIAELVEALGYKPIAQFVHPERDNIYDEAEVSGLMAKYAGQPMKEQVAHYRKDGYPLHFGLWATGCIVSRPGPLAAFGSAWLAEMMRWSWQDQLSEPYVLWKFGLTPAEIPGNLWRSNLVRFDYRSRAHDQ